MNPDLNIYMASRTQNSGWGRIAALPHQNHPSSRSGSRRGGAEVARARRVRPGVNLRRALRVGAWNVLSLSDDHRLPCLSDELRKLRVDIVGLSEVRRPGSGEISRGCYTYYWSGRSDGARRGGVAIGISSRM